MTAPTGWYPDPEHPYTLRWWDGHAWTEFRAPVAGPEWTGGYPARPVRRRRAWPYLLGGFIVLALAVGLLVLPNIVGTLTGSIGGANAYLAAVRDGRSADAYARLCGQLHDLRDYPHFVAQLETDQAEQGRLLSFNAHNAATQSGSRYVFVTVSERTSIGTRATAARMVKEEGQWRWCGGLPAGTSVTIPIP